MIRRRRVAVDTVATGLSTDAEDIHTLVARIRAGDEIAFRALFDAHAAYLVRVAQSYTHSLASAQDVVQDVFLAIWQRRTVFAVRESVIAYLVTVTRHRALNAVRAESRATRREAMVSRDDGLQSQTMPHDGTSHLEAREFAVAFRAAVDALPERQREIFILHRQHGLDHRTIAEALGIGVPSVHNLMSRAMKRLYERLKDIL